jgi:hypothetical protein
MPSSTPGQALSAISKAAAQAAVSELAGKDAYDKVRWDEFGPDAARLAASILDALEAAGHAVVPLEPTPEMMEEGRAAHHGVTDRCRRRIYRTMLAARPR